MGQSSRTSSPGKVVRVTSCSGSDFNNSLLTKKPTNQRTSEQQINNKMVFFSTTLLLAFLCSAQALPTTDLARPDPTENAVDVDQKPEKEVNLENEDTVEEEQERILGSQFAVAFTHPERKGLVTGHRIPLGLFPVETQNRILGLPTREEEDASKYIPSSSFR